MCSVSYLKGVVFSTLPLSDQVEIKRNGRCTPVLKITEEGVTYGSKFTRHFSHKVYELFDWMCGCEISNALYCFPCLLFGRETCWTSTGVSDLKNLKSKAKKHSLCRQHMANVTKLGFLGKSITAKSLSTAKIKKHNEDVTQNRHILSLIIDSLKFCGNYELPLRGHDESSESAENSGVFHGLLGLLGQLDSTLHYHFENSTVFSSNSKTTQNELLECMLEVCRAEISQEIQDSQFVAVMVDDTTDVSEQTQMVVVFRYEREGEVFERFWTFVNPAAQTAEALSACIEEELQKVIKDNPEKLIAQIYDGAAVMKGPNGGVHVLIKRNFPNAHFTHCYAHKLNFVMQQVAGQTSEARFFFSNLTGISSFLLKSPQRLKVLKEEAGTRWNFQMRTVNVVNDNQEVLKACFEKLILLSNSNVTKHEASCMLRLMKDDDFLRWLKFFSILIPDVDVFGAELQNRAASSSSVAKALNKFKRQVSRIRDRIVVAPVAQTAKRRQEDAVVGRSEIEVCHTVVFQAEERFKFTDYLEAAKLVDTSIFDKYSKKFPIKSVQKVAAAYPFLDAKALINQLSVLYDQKEVKDFNCATDLLKGLLEAGLQDVYSEVITLLRVVITTPMTTAESERSFSTLKRVKNYLRSTMGEETEERLNALTMLAAERQLVSSIEEFNQKVIDIFAAKKNRHINLHFK